MIRITVLTAALRARTLDTDIADNTYRPDERGPDGAEPPAAPPHAAPCRGLRSATLPWPG
ncbi:MULTISPECIES: hypothetical protein [Gordonia]|uniref:hypothetical protein n=1 Tax=Gordonia alkanivorans TaxID=84096 RepID=UPI0004AF0114|nr:hypothetical protein [Gordonia alkanivorans]